MEFRQTAERLQAGLRAGRRKNRDGGALPGQVARAASPYMRAHGEGRYARLAAERLRRRRIGKTVAASIAAALLVGIAVALVSAIGFYSSVGSRLNEGVSADTKAVLADQRQTAGLGGELSDTSPFYMLLLGTDSSESRRTGDEAGLYGDSDTAFRTDTIILTRIDPEEKKVALVSIHRDTWYPIDGVYQKINNAYSIGGVAKTIEVVSEYAGVPIVHFAQIDMSGLAALIDALGGVEVNVPYEIDDEYTGHLDAGLQTLNGEQALIFARSRHAYDSLGDGDRYRAAHQRLLIAAIAEKLMNASAVDMVNAIDTMADYVTTDLSTDYIASLALVMRGIDVDHNVYSTMNPTDNEIIGGQSVEVTQEDNWERMMREVDAGNRPDADSGYISQTDDINNPEYTAVATEPSETRVVVKDASGDPQRASEVVVRLQAAGWNAEDGGTANISLEDTAVVYDFAVQQDNAQAVADLLGASCEQAGDTWGVQGDVMVVVGSRD